jgi:hypothetical protein
MALFEATVGKERSARRAEGHVQADVDQADLHQDDVDQEDVQQGPEAGLTEPDPRWDALWARWEPSCQRCRGAHGGGKMVV